MKPNVIALILPTVLSLFLVKPEPGLAQAQQKQDPKINYIIAGIASARAKIRSYHSTTQYYNFEPKEVSAFFKDLFPSTDLKDDVNIENVWVIQHWFQGDFRKSEITYIRGEHEKPNHTRYLLTNSSEGRVLSEDILVDKDGVEFKQYTGSIVPLEMTSKDGFSGDVQRSDPVRLAYPAGLNVYLDDLLKKKLPTVYKGEGELDGILCHKIERQINPSNIQTYWLDKEHDLIVRRIEYMEKVGTKWYLTQVTRTPRIQENNGVWLPALVEKRVSFALPPPYQIGGAKYGQLPKGIAPDRVQTVNGILTVPGRFYRYTIENLRVNVPIAPENLVLEWPPNSNVFNRVTGKVVDTKPKEPQIADKKEADEKSKP